MVMPDRKCSECGKEMLLDRVEQIGNATKLYYTCVNPNCSERGKAFTAGGDESEAHMEVKNG